MHVEGELDKTTTVSGVAKTKTGEGVGGLVVVCNASGLVTARTEGRRRGKWTEDEEDEEEEER